MLGWEGNRGIDCDVWRDGMKGTFVGVGSGGPLPGCEGNLDVGGDVWCDEIKGMFVGIGGK